LYEAKKEEIQTKIDILKGVKNEQDSKVSKSSELLYGSLTDELLEEAKSQIDSFGETEVGADIELL